MNEKIRSWIEAFILIVLAVRPSMDITTGWRVSLGPASLNPAGVLSLLLLVVGVVWLTVLKREERAAILRHPAVLLFGVWLVLLIPWAIGPVLIHGAARIASAREWIRLLSFLPLFAILLRISMRGGFRRVLTALLISLIVPAIVGFYQIAFHQGMMVQNAHRIQSTFAHPNPFSFYLVVMAGLAYWRCRWAERRLGWALVLALTLGLLMATFSFTGAGMLGVLIVVTAMGESRKLRIAILGLMVVFVVLFLATSTGRQRIRTVTQWDSLDEIERTGRETSSMVWRLLNWRFLYRTWKQSPWVGYGLDSSQFVNPNRVLNGTGPGQEPHNDYVRFAIDAGAIGVLLHLTWLGGIGWLLLRAYRRTNASPAQNLIWIAVALYCTWLAGSANDNLLIATAYQYCLWAVFSMAFSGTGQESLQKRQMPSER